MANDVIVFAANDIRMIGEAIAKSGLFGIKTTDQAIALCFLAQAEGRHPATVARDYHIIGTSPAKKAEAMQRDFLMAGGKIEWRELTDEAVEATFSHPIGGTATIRWDTARCKQAGLVGGNHQKFPRQMKRSRVVSEGVRTVWPLATSGMYVPEEAIDFASPVPADARSELDAFASAKPVDIVDGETGEILDEARIEHSAMEAASRGTDALRDHLRGMSREARAALNGKIGTKGAPGSLLLMAMRADDDGGRDPFDEPPTNSPAGDVHPERPHGAVSMPVGETHSPAGHNITDHTTERSRAETSGASGPAVGKLRPGEPNAIPAGDDAITDLLDGPPRPPVRYVFNMPRSLAPRDFAAFADWIDGHLADGVSGVLLRGENTQTLGLLKRVDPALYDDIQEKLGAR